MSKKCRQFKVTPMTARLLAEQLHFDGNLNQLRQGLVVEQEHCDVTHGNTIMTARIAMAHLKEIPDYYTRLKKIEG